MFQAMSLDVTLVDELGCVIHCCYHVIINYDISSPLFTKKLLHGLVLSILKDLHGILHSMLI